MVVQSSFEVPRRYPVSTVYLDDSGVKSAGGRLFVVGGIKVRKHGQLLRAIRHVRDANNFREEFRFSELNLNSLPAFFELIDVMGNSGSHIVATVSSRPSGSSGWEFYRDVTVMLLQGTTQRSELVTVLMDEVSTPRDVAFEDVVRTRVNQRLRSHRIVSAACLNSKTSDGLQCADLVASAIAFERRMATVHTGDPTSPKARVARRLMEAFGLSTLDDVRAGRASIRTWTPPRRPSPLITGDKVPRKLATVLS